MCNDMNKPNDLKDSQLDQVNGGASDTTCLDEHHLPGGWVVTCAHCTLQFFVNDNRDCPSCAGTEVYMSHNASKPIYDSTKRAWYNPVTGKYQ